MRSASVSIALRRPAEWVDSSTSDSRLSLTTTQGRRSAPVHIKGFDFLFFWTFNGFFSVQHVMFFTLWGTFTVYKLIMRCQKAGKSNFIWPGAVWLQNIAKVSSIAYVNFVLKVKKKERKKKSLFSIMWKSQIQKWWFSSKYGMSLKHKAVTLEQRKARGKNARKSYSLFIFTHKWWTNVINSLLSVSLHCSQVLGLSQGAVERHSLSVTSSLKPRAKHVIVRSLFPRKEIWRFVTPFFFTPSISCFLCVGER